MIPLFHQVGGLDFDRDPIRIRDRWTMLPLGQRSQVLLDLEGAPDAHVSLASGSGARLEEVGAPGGGRRFRLSGLTAAGSHRVEARSDASQRWSLASYSVEVCPRRELATYFWRLADGAGHQAPQPRVGIGSAVDAANQLLRPSTNVVLKAVGGLRSLRVGADLGDSVANPRFEVADSRVVASDPWFREIQGACHGAAGDAYHVVFVWDLGGDAARTWKRRLSLVDGRTPHLGKVLAHEAAHFVTPELGRSAQQAIGLDQAGEHINFSGWLMYWDWAGVGAKVTHGHARLINWGAGPSFVPARVGWPGKAPGPIVPTP